MGRKKQTVNIFIVGAVVIAGFVLWLCSLKPVFIIILISLIVVAVIAIFGVKKIEILPSIDADDDVKKEVADLVEFVYKNGHNPLDIMPSKKYQHNILCQIYSWEKDIIVYENLVYPIFENAMKRTNPYINLGHNEIYEQMQFAFSGLCKGFIDLTKDNSHARKYFKDINNLSIRLIQINTSEFKKLFYLVHEYHFWYVYNQDEEYRLSTDRIKKQLKLYHGIKQADFIQKTSHAKDDISYVLHFAEKSGEIIRVKDGHAYRLYHPDDNALTIQNYEFTRAAASESDFDYRNYWKTIEDMLSRNEGILQTEFYKKFEWDKEIIAKSLREAERDGNVIREKKGNTYILRLPG